MRLRPVASTRGLRRSGLAIVAFFAASAAVAVGGSGVAQAPAAAFRPERHQRTAWAPCNRNARNGRPSTFRPLTDRHAAALITRQPETRPYNARPYMIRGRRYPAANDYVPSPAQIRSYRASRTSAGEPLLKFNPYDRYVDGRDGIRHPSTDDLIQWAAHKWGIPEDWLRAEYVVESYWNQFNLGDPTTVSSRWYRRYPYQSRIPHTTSVYQSLGLAQVRWVPDGSLEPGTEPLRWKSTAFNIDEQAAKVRFYYDNPSGARAAWNDSTYAPCQKWRSIGGWYNPYPWGNPGQAGYVSSVRTYLAERLWSSPSFVAWAPTSFPPGVVFR